MALILKVISVSSRSKLIIFPFRISFFRNRIESVIFCGKRCIFFGKSARCFVALITRLEAACMNGEFSPVTMVPSLSLMAAPQKMPSLPLPSFCAFRAACRAGNTTVRSYTLAPAFSMISSDLSRISLSTNPIAYSQAHLK